MAVCIVHPTDFHLLTQQDFWAASSRNVQIGMIKSCKSVEILNDFALYIFFNDPSCTPRNHKKHHQLLFGTPNVSGWGRVLTWWLVPVGRITHNTILSLLEKGGGTAGRFCAEPPVAGLRSLPRRRFSSMGKSYPPGKLTYPLTGQVGRWFPFSKCGIG